MTQTPPSADTVLLTIPETARELRVARATVYRLINSGALPTVRVGHARRVERTALTTYIRNNRSAVA